MFRVLHCDARVLAWHAGPTLPDLATSIFCAFILFSVSCLPSSVFLAALCRCLALEAETQRMRAECATECATADEAAQRYAPGDGDHNPGAKL